MEIFAFVWLIILSVLVGWTRRDNERWTDEAAEEMNQMKRRIEELEGKPK